MRTKSKFLMMSVAVIMTLAMSAVMLAGCSGMSGKTDKLSNAKTPMSDISGMNVSLKNKASNDALVNFSGNLITNVYDQDNTLVSPLSVYLGLSMLANGASGNTQAELLSGLGLSVTKLNEYCGSLFAYYMEQSKEKEVQIANSIWYNNFVPKDEFMAVNSSNFGADMYKSDFSKSTVKDMNKWVKKSTDGMIKQLIDELSPTDLYVILSAILFSAQWSDDNYSYSKSDFTNLDNTVIKSDVIRDRSSKYYYNDNCKAFTNPFKGHKLAFMGILPNGGVDFDSFVRGFNGKQLSKLLATSGEAQVEYSIPKFDYDYDVDLKSALGNMGMGGMFKPNAEFKNMSDIATYPVSEVKHKTSIKLDKNGVKAGGAFSIRGAGSAAPPELKIDLYLDRPFMYILLDTAHNVPIFIGTVTSLK